MTTDQADLPKPAMTCLSWRPETRPTLERSTFLRHISGALQRWTSLHPRERSRFVEQSVVLLSLGHVTNAQTATLFSSVAILLPWEQFLSSSGALPWVQKLRALRRERSSVGRGHGLPLEPRFTNLTGYSTDQQGLLAGRHAYMQLAMRFIMQKYVLHCCVAIGKISIDTTHRAVPRR